MTPRAPVRRRREAGFVLVAVLGGVLVLAAVAFAMLYTASLDAMAVRARQRSVVTREVLEGALALTAAELHLLSESGAPAVAGNYGPWPQLGLTASVSVQVLPAEEGEQVVRLEARMEGGSAHGAESLILRLRPDTVVLRR